MTPGPVIASSLAGLRSEIQQHAGSRAVRLVAVSKFKTTAAILEAVAAGQKDFGENYAQELRDKAYELKNQDVRWHFIGPLQTNKIKYVVGTACLIHTLDRLALAQSLNERAKNLGIVQSCLIEIKIASDDKKSGLAPASLEAFLKEVSSCKNLHIDGLMTIATHTEDVQKIRDDFRTLRLLRDDIRQKGIAELPELSMGMSSDFMLALDEGATILRIGTRIFGERP